EFQTSAVNRWGWEVTGVAESGSNVGSDIRLRAYSDAGATLFTPINITRSTGLMTISALALSGPTARRVLVSEGASAAITSTARGTAGRPRASQGASAARVSTTPGAAQSPAFNTAGSTTTTSPGTMCGAAFSVTPSRNGRVILHVTGNLLNTT